MPHGLTQMVCESYHLTYLKLEIVFVKYCAPNYMLVHKDSALYKDKGHLKFEAPS